MRSIPSPLVQGTAAFFDALSQMFTVGSTTGVSRRRDLDGRHTLADGVDNLRRNTL